jgi:hypothetical protein
MKNLILCFGLFAGSLSAQIPTGTHLLVPFEDLMYNSMVDKELAYGTAFNATEIMRQVKDAMMVNLQRELNREFEVRALSIYDTIGSEQALDYIYSGITYIDEPVKVEKKNNETQNTKTALASLKEKLPVGKREKSSDEPEPGSRIENGELVTVRDNREKFMKTVVTRASLPSTVTKEMNVSGILFINQMDIEMVPSGYGEDDRKMVLHFTWIDGYGNTIQGGKILFWYNSIDNQLTHMLKKHIPTFAAEFAEKLNTSLTDNAGN